uniref:Leiomodin 2 n=1 Tax=Rousettus aegyptiacus TaxID=9407 RepID=A0A7J8D6W1_ROUAE|nr:leiomodin 2 [Rousettus aegyptiacus]
MSTFGYRRGLSKYESIDEDELLASLSAEELKELERELEDIEPDRNLPVGLRQKSLTEKTPTGNFSREALMAYWEKESQKLLEKERLGECGKKKKKGKKVKKQPNNILKEIKNSLRSVQEKKMEDSSRPSTPQRSAHDNLMEAIRGSSIRQLKKVSSPVADPGAQS